MWDSHRRGRKLRMAKGSQSVYLRVCGVGVSVYRMAEKKMWFAHKVEEGTSYTHTHTEECVCMAAPVLWDKGLPLRHPSSQIERWGKEHDRRRFTQESEAKVLRVRGVYMLLGRGAETRATCKQVSFRFQMNEKEVKGIDLEVNQIYVVRNCLDWNIYTLNINHMLQRSAF